MVRRLTQQQKTIRSVHDASGNRIAEYELDALTGTSTLLREYVWMDGVVIAVVEGGAIYHVRTDHIGRPVFATDENGLVVWEASYLPFGGVHVSTGAAMDLRFPGQWFQAESGLHQNWMRDYDPTTGRYIQADPLGLVDGASVYGYALESPMRWTDPTGEFVVRSPDYPFGKNADECRYTDRTFVDGLERFIRVGDLDDGVDDDLLNRQSPIQIAPFGGGAGRGPGGPNDVGLVGRGHTPPPGTRVRPDGIPSTWKPKPSRTGNGTIYRNPRNPNDNVRVMPGNPNSPYPASQAPYARQQNSAGKYLDRFGNPSLGPRGGKRDAGTHIPLGSFSVTSP
ncbi:RHS repeat-associated core domain-containing protein [Jannaschia aquimarina]|uniref:RHS repeat-associated core domain-containing protein n=1 Tax=Jannaschia aquimarina TaxID=935700 RepID=UPI001130BFB1|nr:RHS repeat-associated core domain-containing protein [Jannaschia aquimarina]